MTWRIKGAPARWAQRRSRITLTDRRALAVLLPSIAGNRREALERSVILLGIVHRAIS